MRTTTKIILAICCIGAVAVETLTPVYARRCQPGWTVQGGRCQPYRWGGSGYAWQRRGGTTTGAVALAGVVALTPGMDAHTVGRYRAEDAHPIDGAVVATDWDGEVGGELTC